MIQWLGPQQAAAFGVCFGFGQDIQELQQNDQYYSGSPQGVGQNLLCCCPATSTRSSDSSGQMVMADDPVGSRGAVALNFGSITVASEQ